MSVSMLYPYQFFRYMDHVSRTHYEDHIAFLGVRVRGGGCIVK